MENLKITIAVILLIATGSFLGWRLTQPDVGSEIHCVAEDAINVERDGDHVVITCKD